MPQKLADSTSPDCPVQQDIILPRHFRSMHPAANGTPFPGDIAAAAGRCVVYMADAAIQTKGVPGILGLYLDAPISMWHAAAPMPHS